MIINRNQDGRVNGTGLNVVGSFVCKVDKVEQDKPTNQGDLRLKFTFSVLVGKDDIKTYSESFPLTGNASFLMSNFETAMKCPDMYNVDDLVGRYVIGIFTENKYIDKKDGTEKSNIKASKWDYSDVNDKKGLAPIKEATESDDEDSSEIPF